MVKESTPERKKVLIIDDEKDLREALFITLAAEGYETLSAVDGEEGLAIALKDKPDIILLDLQMPKLDGHGVLESLRSDEWGKRVAVIVLTAQDDMGTVSRTLEAGGLDYIVKTDVALKDVVRKVAEVLAR